ncbi:MAG: FAD-binding oxidoreductase [Thermomicrobiales bacterium]
MNDFADLRLGLQGEVLMPGNPGYQEAVASWVVNAGHRPDLVVLAECASDIQLAVRFAGARGLPVGVQATGHGVLAPVTRGLLINTSRMQGVSVDPVARTARVEAGVKWAKVVPLAQEHGLAPLLGSTTDVGVVGYTLGGGTGWLARHYGFAADRIVSADLVTADGDLIHVTEVAHPELFWALRGGSGNFGIVAALEFELVPVSTVFGGTAFYPIAHAREVLSAFAAWTEGLPETITASCGIMRLPPMPQLPPPLQGATVVFTRACGIGDLEQAEAIIGPIREIGGIAPVMDTFGVMPFAAIDAISMDPVDPMPFAATTTSLDALDEATIDRLLAVAGEGVETPVMMIDIRYIAGAVDRMPRRGGVANRHDAPMAVMLGAVVFDPAMGPAVHAALAEVKAALSPAASRSLLLNFLHLGDASEEQVRACFAKDDYLRLRQVKADLDPGNMFRYNANIPPATVPGVPALAGAGVGSGLDLLSDYL